MSQSGLTAKWLGCVTAAVLGISLTCLFNSEIKSFTLPDNKSAKGGGAQWSLLTTHPHHSHTQRPCQQASAHLQTIARANGPRLTTHCQPSHKGDCCNCLKMIIPSTQVFIPTPPLPTGFGSPANNSTHNGSRLKAHCQPGHNGACCNSLKEFVPPASTTPVFTLTTPLPTSFGSPVNNSAHQWVGAQHIASQVTTVPAAIY